MKLSKLTLDIFKYAAKLNEHIVIPRGNIIRTVNKFGTTLMKCEVPEVFEHEVRLHNLNEFIRILTLFEEPEFDVFEDKIEIFDSLGARQAYPYPKKSDLLYESRNPPNMEPICQFPLQTLQLKNLVRAAQMNKVEDVGFFCDPFSGNPDFTNHDGTIYIRAHNKKRISNEFSLNITRASGVKSDTMFEIYLKHGRKCAKMAFLELDYTVTVGQLNKNAAMKLNYEDDTHKVEYLIAGEHGSYVGYPDDIPF